MTTTVEMLIKEAAGLGSKTIEKSAASTINKEEAINISTGLVKVAAMPYKQDVYTNVQEMMKIAANSLDSLVAGINDRDEKISSLEKIAEVRGIIDEMLDRKIIERGEVFEKSAELLKKSNHELEITKEAMSIGTMTSKNIFFEESEKTASTTKRGMFDNVEGL